MTTEIIEKYLKNKDATLIKIINDEDFLYERNGTEITGFVSNATEWYNNLYEIENNKYEIVDWFKSKNRLDLSMLFGNEKKGVNIKRETEKAYLLIGEEIELWIPKSALKKID